MKTSWKLQDAKAKFSQLVDDAIEIGPQYITQRGNKAVVVLSVREYEKIISKKPSFKEFILDCPKMEASFEFTRQKDYS